MIQRSRFLTSPLVQNRRGKRLSLRSKLSCKCPNSSSRHGFPSSIWISTCRQKGWWGLARVHLHHRSFQRGHHLRYRNLSLPLSSPRAPHHRQRLVRSPRCQKRSSRRNLAPLSFHDEVQIRMDFAVSVGSIKAIGHRYTPEMARKDKVVLVLSAWLSGRDNRTWPTRNRVVEKKKKE